MLLERTLLCFKATASVRSDAALKQPQFCRPQAATILPQNKQPQFCWKTSSHNSAALKQPQFCRKTSSHNSAGKQANRA
jgi:hypothetical protein